MRPRPLLLLPVLMMWALGCANSPGHVSAAGPTSPGPAGIPGSFGVLEAEIVDRLNALRSREGLSALKSDAEALTVAREHSSAMARGRRSFGHDGFAKRISHMAARNPAENVFWSSRQGGVAEQVIQTWFDSPPHRKNMLGDHRVVGIGVARNGKAGKLYVTGIFAR